MKICLGAARELTEGLKYAASALGITFAADGLPLEWLAGGNEIDLSFDGKRLKIQCANGRFVRALGLAAERLKESDAPFALREEAAFDTLGVMLDMSRNAVMNLETIKEFLAAAAVMGFNAAMLYTEDVYEMPEYPYFGYMRGRYRKEELRAADDFAHSLGMELIPCIQTLAHLEHTLRWRYAEGMRDYNDCMLAGEAETYALIESMIKTAAETFRSRRIHIGMDEADSMGRGKYLDKHGYKNRIELYTEHLKKVTELTARYGLQPTLYSDMFIAAGSKTHGHQDPDTVLPQELIREIPADATLVYWDYFKEREEDYLRLIKAHTDAGIVPAFAGSAWTYIGSCHRHDKAFGTSKPALSACRRAGIKEVWCTLWQDGGAEVDVFTAFLTLQLFAEYAFGHTPNDEALAARLKTCSGMDAELLTTISAIDDIQPYPGFQKSPEANPSFFVMWQDFLLGFADKHLAYADFAGHFETIEKKLRNFLPEAGKYAPLLERYICLCGAAAAKAFAGVEMKRLYDAQDRDGLRAFAQDVLPALRERTAALRESHRKLWHLHNKPFGWEVMDVRYGGVLARIDTASWRIGEYCAGRLDALEELAAKRLCFNGEVNGVPHGNLHIPWMGFYEALTTAGDLSN
ncbi:MAG: beta-N-acetylhexosaminidase [Clostridiales bacterium]|nr:beta-N-acetylhexosaminidase [Clostridiales bacterium]